MPLTRTRFFRGGAEAATKPDAVTTPAPIQTEVPLTRRVVIDRIIAECDAAQVKCDRSKAGWLLNTMAKAAAHIGASTRPYFFTQNELDGLHDIMDVVMPDNFVRNGLDIPIGSAHAGINALCTTGTQYALDHTKAMRFSRDDCAVKAHARFV